MLLGELQISHSHFDEAFYLVAWVALRGLRQHVAEERKTFVGDFGKQRFLIFEMR
jgi:hypothetical protein